MKLTKQGEYAIRAITELGRSYSKGLISAKEISANQDIPLSYLPKILSLLTKKGIVRSQRGNSGGISLAKSPNEFTLQNVIEAVEGPFALNECLGEAGNCERTKHCKVHVVWEKAQQAMLKELQITLDELI